VLCKAWPGLRVRAGRVQLRMNPAPATDPACSRPRPVLRFPAAGTGTLANLEQLGYRQMTPIQAASLPPALAGKDLIAQAKTGSGKTAAFALSLLARLNPRRFAVQALVLCPTRELADQVARKSAAWRAAPTTSRY
jgi:ATP-independent RNA helicase DbpA